MATAIEVEKPHIVCMPFPAQGHIHAMLKLARILHFKGFHITFVHSEFDYDKILTSSGSSSLEGLKDFRFETIPDGLPMSDTMRTQDLASLCNAIQYNMPASFRDLMKRLADPSSGVPPVTSIVSDSFTSFTLEIAREFRIPDVFFCPVNACSYMGVFQCKELKERGITPLKSEDDLNNGYLDTPIDWIPGMNNIRLKDLPSFVRTTDPNDVMYEFLITEGQAAKRATAIIINTFDDLEESVLDALSLVLPPIYAIGPLTLLHKEIPNDSLKAIGSNSLWKEDGSCLEWLEGRATGSVIYVNFGSTTTMTNHQLLEFAWGLSNSNHDFLWVIRPDVVMGDSAVLPKEFLEETRKRGFLSTWCPQEQVLMHQAVGGFLTHCGWNSMSESISSAVPMICWPYFGDQQTNCRYACSEWGIAMEVDNDVKREEVEGLIRELMGGKKGKQMKREALKLKEDALIAVKPGGKSFKNFNKVINEVLLGIKE